MRFQLSVWNVYWDRPENILGAVVFAENFGIARFSSGDRNHSFQVGISGGAIAQFDLLAPSSDLINTDFIGGLPFTYRQGDWSAKFRWYHQSSHLGDEFILNNNTQRINLSFESLEGLASYDWNAFRMYGGGEVVYRTEPNFDPLLLHLGAEYRHPKPFHLFTETTGGFWVGAMDVKMWQLDDFTPSISLKGGIQFTKEGNTEESQRILRVLLEFYSGLAPNGQFFVMDQRTTGIGLGIQISL
jgi:hypothetical protein